MRLSSDADVRGWTSSTIATVDDDDRDADGLWHPPRPPRRPRAPPLAVAEGDGTKASEVEAAEGEPPAVRMVIPAAVAARLRLQGFVIVAAGLEGIPRHAVSVGMELCVWLPIIYYRRVTPTTSHSYYYGIVPTPRMMGAMRYRSLAWGYWWRYARHITEKMM